MTFKGLSLNLTVGFPSAVVALQTREKGTRLSARVRPRKSFVSNVPHPNDTFVLPENLQCKSDICSTSRPSEKIINLFRGSSPHLVHHFIAISAEAIGSPESILIPVQLDNQSGAFSKKFLVP